MKTKLTAPGTKRLKVKHDDLLSRFAFKFNLRRYSMVLKQQFKLSDVTILFLVLAVPVTVGMLCIFIVDMYIVSNEKKAGAYTRPLLSST
jgi:hypothetical protein